MKSYRDLTVWERSFELAKSIYQITGKLPDSEKFGLVSQMRRCAVSIPSNIAEGQQRNSKKEFMQFLYVSRGSAVELRTQLELAQDIYEVDCESLIERTKEVSKMLYALLKSIEKL